MSNRVFKTLCGSTNFLKFFIAKLPPSAFVGFSVLGSRQLGRVQFGPSCFPTRGLSTQRNDVIKDVTPWTDFQSIETKTKESFLEMVEIYKDREKQLRRGHVEFIYSALKYMKEFGVEKDLEIYKALIDIFPKGLMIPKNTFQVMMMHYPKQQQCAIDLLEQMEQNRVIPDWDMEDQLVNVFGRKGHPVRKYWRMMYWMPKFKNASPWKVPDSLSSDPYQLALHAIERITSVDASTKIEVYKEQLADVFMPRKTMVQELINAKDMHSTSTKSVCENLPASKWQKTAEIEDALEDTWIVSGQSLDQQRLLGGLPENTPVYVEGRYKVYIRNHAVTYFVLRADIKTLPPPKEDYDDITDMYFPLFQKPQSGMTIKPTVHEQDDGIILAVCCTGTSSRDSLLSWIRSLEKENPHLAKLTVVFTLKAPPEETSMAHIDEDAREETITDGRRNPV